MAEELRLQVAETDELQNAKKMLEEESKKLRRDVALNEQVRVPWLGGLKSDLPPRRLTRWATLLTGGLYAD